jgi:hypothetical protein
MNFIDPLLPQSREARIKYLDGDYQVLKEGEFVRCAVTGDPIRIDELRYWSVERQEPYRSAAIAFGQMLKRLGIES